MSDRIFATQILKHRASASKLLSAIAQKAAACPHRRQSPCSVPTDGHPQSEEEATAPEENTGAPRLEGAHCRFGGDLRYLGHLVAGRPACSGFPHAEQISGASNQGCCLDSCRFSHQSRSKLSPQLSKYSVQDKDPQAVHICNPNTLESSRM